MVETPAQAAASEQNYTEPADYDSWYSAIVSGVFHFLLVLFAALITSVVTTREALPPAVEVVQVAAATSSGGESVDDAAGEPLETSEDRPMPSPTPEPATQEKISSVTPIDVPDVTQQTQDTKVNVSDQLAKTRQAAASAAASAAAKINENLGGSPPSGGGGTGSGRAGRAARWVLRFNTGSPTEYLSQLGSLGAEIAFPQRGDSYLYFSDLAGSPTSAARDLSNENRIYWMDQDPRSYGSVAAHLGVSSPPLMIAFMPLPLEEKMLQLEKAYKGVTDEDQIIQTIFDCVRRGNGFDVVVTDQKVRGE